MSDSAIQTTTAPERIRHHWRIWNAWYGTRYRIGSRIAGVELREGEAP